MALSCIQKREVYVTREDTRVVRTGDRVIGGGNPVLIQSVCGIKTEDVHATMEQIRGLEQAGCDIIHVAVPIMGAVSTPTDTRKEVRVPPIADVHFGYHLAIAAMKNGADRVRINPGNVDNRHKVQTTMDQAREYGVPIRVGVNSDSLGEPLLKKYEGVAAEGIMESVLDKMKLIEDMGYDNLITSIKPSGTFTCVKTHELIVMWTHYSPHMGVTEPGTLMFSNIKSSVGLGTALHEGIGGAIRVSLTGDPMEEIESAKLILWTLGLKKDGIEVVFYPTCGRIRIDSAGPANQVEDMVTKPDGLDMKVIAMRCVVGGPGEARRADIDITGGVGRGPLI